MKKSSASTKKVEVLFLLRFFRKKRVKGSFFLRKNLHCVEESGNIWNKVEDRKETGSMFIGEYTHSIDEKGRIIIPVKFRAPLGESFIATKGLDGCLFLFPYKEWDAFEAKLKTLQLGSKKARAVSRAFFGSATECQVDKQGRIMLPKPLREYANLDKDICVIGVSERVEVWDMQTWKDYNDPEAGYAAVLEDNIEEMDI